MRRRRTVFMATCGLFLSASVQSATNAEIPTRESPNILLIVTDQQHAGMMSCAGNRWLKTPAMDSLASLGTRFERAYSTNPVCVPSRFSLLTGHYPSVIGMRHNGSETSNAEAFLNRAMGTVFRRAGYRTMYGGKVHLPGAMRNIKECGFETVISRER